MRCDFRDWTFQSVFWPLSLLCLGCSLLHADEALLQGESEVPAELEALADVPSEIAAGFFREKAQRLIDAALNREASEKTCVGCNSWAGGKFYGPEKTFGFSFDVLYFKPVEDNLKYGHTNTVSLTPPCHTIDQEFSYKLGARATVHVPLYYDEWGLDLSYMYFHPTMPTTTRVDPNQYLFMTLTQTYFVQVNNALNIQCGEIKGDWKLKMDVGTVELKRSCWFSKSFLVNPIIGVQGADVRQRLVVHYGNLYINNGSSGPNGPILNAQKITSASEVWGIGPEVGAEMRFLIPEGFNLFFRAACSSMFGQFKTTTKYTDVLASYADSFGAAVFTFPTQQISVIKETVARSFSVLQIQATVSKLWKFGNTGSVELMLGWETQFWWSQNRFNWFSTIAIPSEGSDLNIQGPFGRLDFQF